MKTVSRESRAFVDTNILVYACEPHEEKYGRSKRFVEEGFKGIRDLAVSAQILAELYAVISRKSEHPIETEQAARFIEAFVAGWRVFDYSKDTLIHAVSLAEQYQIEIWDALIAATMLDNKVYTIYTENEKDFSKIPGLKVINPLKS